MPDNLPESSELEETAVEPSRRELLKLGNSLILPAVMGGTSQVMASTGPLKTGPGIYQSIGVEPVALGWRQRVVAHAQCV